MFCPYCGQQMNDTAKFCPKCGKPSDEFDQDVLVLEEEAPRPVAAHVKPQPKPRPKRIERQDDYDAYDDNDYYAERDVDDPMERLRTRTKSTYKTVSREVSRQIQSRALQNWQALTIGLAGLAVVCLLIALFSGSTTGFMDIIGSTLFIYFSLKRPKFDAPEMIIPAALFSILFLQNGFSMLISGSSLYVDTIDTIAELLSYLFLAIYFLMLIGKIRDINAASYLMLALCASLVAYYIYGIFLNIQFKSFKGIASAIGRTAFNAAYLIFIYKAPKPKLRKGKISGNQRLMARWFNIVSSKYANYDFSNEHSYYTLGGALQGIVYVGYALTGAIGIVGIIYLVTMIKRLNLGYYFSNAKVGSVMVCLLHLAVYLMFVAFLMYLGYVLFTKIRKRDETFIKFYHITMIVWACAGFILVMTYGTFMNSLGELFGAALLTVLGTVYFTRSVRVSTYMCTDEYMRHSIFTKNMEAPEPAEYDEDDRHYNDRYDEYDD